MKKFLAAIFVVLAQTANAGSPFIFKGSVAKNLASSGIEVSNSSTKQILDLTVDPRIGSGVPAAVGSIGMGVGQIFYKYGSGDTQWYAMAPTSGSPDTVAGFSTAGELYNIPEWTTVNNLGAKSLSIYQTMEAITDPGSVTIKAHNFELDLDAQSNSTATNYKNIISDAHYDRLNSGGNLTGSWTNIDVKTGHEGSGTVASMNGIVSDVSKIGSGFVTDALGIRSVISANTANSSTAVEGSISGNTHNATSGSFKISGNTTNNAVGVESSISGTHNSGFTIYNGSFTGSSSGNGSFIQLSANSGSVTGNLTGVSLSNNGGTNDWQGYLSAINGNVSGDSTQFNSYDNWNTTGNFTGLNVSKSGTAANMYGANIQFNSAADSVDSILFNGTDAGDHSSNSFGVNVQLTGTAADVIGLNSNITGTYSSSVTGLNINVSSATNTGSPVNRKTGILLNGGHIEGSFSHRTVSSLPTLVDSGNILAGELNIDSGSPITGTDYIGNNLSQTILAEDNFGSSSLGIGWAGVGFVGQVAVASGKTVDKASFAVGGGLVEASSSGGTITDLANYRAISPIDGGGTLSITDLYAFKAENTAGSWSSGFATNAYGIYLDDSGFKNYLGGTTRVGGSSYVAPTEALDVTGSGRFSSSIKLEDPGAGTDVITIQAPTLTAPYTLTLPVDDGAPGELLSTNGSGVLSWAPPAVTSPLTTKGDLYTYDTDNTRLPVGLNDEVLMADSSTSTGLKYAKIIDANIDSAAAIARSKIAVGAANHVIINDGTGALSSEASLAETRGGTAQTTYTTGDILYSSATDTLSKLSIGASGQVLTVVGGVPSWSAASPVAPVVFGSIGTPRAIVAANGINSTDGHMSTVAGQQKIYVEGSGGAVDITSNPQIEAGTIDGQEMLICGNDDTNTVKLDNGDGLVMNGSAVLQQHNCVKFSWNTSAWVEIHRNF